MSRIKHCWNNPELGEEGAERWDWVGSVELRDPRVGMLQVRT